MSTLLSLLEIKWFDLCQHIYINITYYGVGFGNGGTGSYTQICFISRTVLDFETGEQDVD